MCVYCVSIGLTLVILTMHIQCHNYYRLTKVWQRLVGRGSSEVVKRADVHVLRYSCMCTVAGLIKIKINTCCLTLRKSTSLEGSEVREE